MSKDEFGNVTSVSYPVTGAPLIKEPSPEGTAQDATKQQKQPPKDQVTLSDEGKKKSAEQKKQEDDGLNEEFKESAEGQEDETSEQAPESKDPEPEDPPYSAYNKQAKPYTPPSERQPELDTIG